MDFGILMPKHSKKKKKIKLRTYSSSLLHLTMSHNSSIATWIFQRLLDFMKNFLYFIIIIDEVQQPTNKRRKKKNERPKKKKIIFISFLSRLVVVHDWLFLLLFFFSFLFALLVLFLPFLAFSFRFLFVWLDWCQTIKYEIWLCRWKISMRIVFDIFFFFFLLLNFFFSILFYDRNCDSC